MNTQNKENKTMVSECCKERVTKMPNDFASEGYIPLCSSCGKACEVVEKEKCNKCKLEGNSGVCDQCNPFDKPKEDIDTLAHAYQECVQPPHCEEFGEGYWEGIKFAKSFYSKECTCENLVYGEHFRGCPISPQPPEKENNQSKEEDIVTRFSDMETSGRRTEWICPHGIGHHMGVHGCDGCCANEPKMEKTTKDISTPPVEKEECEHKYRTLENINGVTGEVSYSKKCMLCGQKDEYISDQSNTIEKKIVEAIKEAGICYGYEKYDESDDTKEKPMLIHKNSLLTIEIVKAIAPLFTQSNTIGWEDKLDHELAPFIDQSVGSKDEVKKFIKELLSQATQEANEKAYKEGFRDGEQYANDMEISGKSE